MVSSRIDILTTPEIEILFIVYKGDFDKFKNQKPNKSGKKLPAHEWCKKFYNMKDVKSPEFVYDYWNYQPDKLVETIRLYSQKCDYPFENTLASILKK